MSTFKKIHIQKYGRIKHVFKCEDGFMIRNLRFKIRWNKHSPKGWRLHIQIWFPFVHISRDNSKWEIGNKRRLVIYH